MKYILIETSRFPESLVEEVNKALAKGWKCQGGVSVFTANNQLYWTQAMIKE